MCLHQSPPALKCDAANVFSMKRFQRANLHHPSLDLGSLSNGLSGSKQLSSLSNIHVSSHTKFLFHTRLSENEGPAQASRLRSPFGGAKLTITGIEESEVPIIPRIFWQATCAPRAPRPGVCDELGGQRGDRNRRRAAATTPGAMCRGRVTKKGKAPQLVT